MWVTINLGGGTWQNEVSWDVQGFDGGVGNYDACLQDGCISFNMYDSWGDGWNNNAFSIINSDGQILHNVSLEDGDFGFYQFCLSSGCYDLVMDNSGIYSNEVSWEIIDSDENLILNGLSPSNSVLEVNNFCNLSVDNNNIKEKKIIKILNVLGQVILENNLKSNSIFFEIYDDGSVVKKILN